MTASRRVLVGGGLAALALADLARAQDAASGAEAIKRQMMAPQAEALDIPALRGNFLAFTFKQPPANLVVPKVKLERRSGLGDFKPQPGLTLLSLWAPWCAPCLMELRDLAEQQPVYETDRFRILPVLTGAMGEVTLKEARAVLDKAGAPNLEAVIDRSPDAGSLFSKLTSRDTGKGVSRNLPCNLVVDSRGRVLARQFGAPLARRGGGKPAAETQGEKRSMWAASEGHALLKALQKGEIAGAASTPS